MRLTRNGRLMRLWLPLCTSVASTDQRQVPSGILLLPTRWRIQPRLTTPACRQATVPSGRSRRRSTDERRTTFAATTFLSPTPSPLGDSTDPPALGA